MKIEISFDEGALATIITNAVAEALLGQGATAVNTPVEGSVSMVSDDGEGDSTETAEATEAVILAKAAKAEKAAKAKAKRDAKKADADAAAAAEAEAEAAAEPAEGDVTLATLRDLLRDFIGENSRDEAIEILKQSDAKSLSTLDEAQFATVAAKLAA